VKPGAVGTFNYQVIVKVRCTADTLKRSVHVMPFPSASIVGNDSVCPGTNTVLTASGGSSYLWSNGKTTASIVVAPKTNTTYTVIVSNGRCTKDTTFTVYTRPAPVITVTGTTKVCQGDTIYLSATAPGGGSYSWSNGATTSSIKISPVTPADTSFWVSMTKGCSDTARHHVTVTPVTPLMAWVGVAPPYSTDTTVQLGTSVGIHASGAVGYVWDPAGTLSCFTCPNPIATPTATTTYTVVGTDSNGCRSYGTVTIHMECMSFTVPNVFTPNGDHFNDLFEIKAIGEGTYSIEIFDRWGKVMYKSTDPSQPWNGKVNNNGGDCPDGVYYYIIKATCDVNNYDFHGFVQIIRGN
jgi:gliding motility-associated-like protein